MTWTVHGIASDGSAQALGSPFPHPAMAKHYRDELYEIGVGSNYDVLVIEVEERQVEPAAAARIVS